LSEELEELEARKMEMAVENWKKELTRERKERERWMKEKEV